MIQTILGILLLLGALYLLYQTFAPSTVSKEGFRIKSQNFVTNNRFDNANKLDYGTDAPPGMYSKPPSSVSGPSNINGVNKNSNVDIFDNRGFKWNYNGSDPKIDAFTDEATNAELRNKYQRTYMLDPKGDVAKYDLSYNETSSNCCAAQWSPPFKLNNKDKSNCSYAQKYVANQYSGNNFDDSSGCLCVTPKQATFYGQRGGNA